MVEKNESSEKFSDNAGLLKRVKEGDKEALDRLVAQNMGLVKSIALRFRDRGVEYEDLVQIGALGMLKAVRSFDFSYNTVFSTYAVPLIIGEIKRFLRDDGPIKVGRSIKRMSMEISKKREEYIQKNGREPRASELAELCSITVEELYVACDAASPIRSLDDPVGNGDALTLGGTIADTNNELDIATDRIALREAISKLDPMHREIVLLRYFKNLSQQQTGDILGISQVKVSREEKKIMASLRSCL